MTTIIHSWDWAVADVMVNLAGHALKTCLVATSTSRVEH